MDKDEQLGQPVVPNGIPLSKIHHAAFDASSDAELNKLRVKGLL
jgi:predicted restriction endonuclease